MLNLIDFSLAALISSIVSLTRLPLERGDVAGCRFSAARIFFPPLTWLPVVAWLPSYSAHSGIRAQASAKQERCLMAFKSQGLLALAGATVR